MAPTPVAVVHVGWVNDEITVRVGHKPIALLVALAARAAVMCDRLWIYRIRRLVAVLSSGKVIGGASGQAGGPCWFQVASVRNLHL